MAILLVTSHQMKALQTQQIKPKKLAKLSKPSLSEFIEHFILMRLEQNFVSEFE
jgi:hypothetical protein